MKRKSGLKSVWVILGILMSILPAKASIVHAESYPQTLTLELKNVSLRQAFNEISREGNYHFVYRDDLIPSDYRLTLSVRQATIREVMDRLLSKTALTYRLENGKIVIVFRKTNLLASFPEVLVITGIVRDKLGLPLSGVSIVQKGTKNGTVTDERGEFRLRVQSQNAVLIASYVGYESQELPWDGKNLLHFSLKALDNSLNEIVVIGYGTQKKSDLTGAVNVMKMDDLGSRPLTNTGAALQGQMPGVYALQNSGKAGGDDAVINIRGVGTLNNSDPLVIIDGFPGSIGDVNAQDVESISVLKDAASASIYGNRAANGVIIITTRKGTSKKLKMSYTAYMGRQKATALPKVMNSYQYTTLYNEAAENSGQTAKYTDAEIQKYKDGTDPMYPSINYFNVYYRAANMQEHHVNVTGGGDNLNYALMFGYLNQEGILVGNRLDRYTLRSNMEGFFLKDRRLKISADIYAGRGDNINPADEWDTKWYATVAPIWPLKNTSGEWVAVNGERNLLGELNAGSYSDQLKTQLNSVLKAELRVLQGLNLEFSYGYNWTQYYAKSFTANFVVAKIGGGYNTTTAHLNESNEQDVQTMLNALIRYDRTFGVHKIGLLGGYSQEYFRTDQSSGYRSGYINNTQQYLDMGNASTETNGGGANELGLESFFGRFSYSLMDRYLLEANIRSDGSSRFAYGHRWGTFPSFSVGWRISQEPFMKRFSNWLDDMKFRASWGKLGNQNINSRYAASQVLSSGQNYVLGGALASGVAITSLANAETSWETTSQTDVGLDFAFLKNFTATVDYFWKKTTGILIQIPIPITMGDLTAPYQNVGKVSNNGWEFSLNYHHTFSNKMVFSVTANLSHIHNKVLDLYGRSPIINGSQALVEGSAVNAFYGYKTNGLYQESDFTWQNNSDGTIPVSERQYTLKSGVVSVANYTAQPGDLKFADLNKDGTVTMDKDRTVIGKQYPDYTYSTQFSLSWKGLDFSAFIQGVQGIQGYGYYEIYTPFSGFANTGTWWTGRWTPTHTNTKYPRLTLDDARRNIYSTFYMMNASYLRLKNLELGYSLPSHWLDLVGINSFRVFANIQNVFTITKFKGFDPEQPTSETRAEAYPQTRIFTVGLNVGF